MNTPPAPAPRREFPADVMSRPGMIVKAMKAQCDVPGLLHLLTHPRHEVRGLAAWALSDLQTAALDPLIAFLNDKQNLRGRDEAALALGEIADPRAFDALAAALLDVAPDFKQNYELRKCAASALGSLSDSRAIEPLLRALKDPHSDVRRDAAEALGKLKDRRAVGPLIETLHDRGYGVREEAAKALGRIGDPSARVALEETGRDKDKHFAKVVARALLEIGGDATFASEEAFLEAIRKGRVEDVRQWLSKGMDPNRGKTYSETTLHMAIHFGRKEVVVLLLEAGALIEGRDQYGHTPLAAAAVGQVEIAQLLIDRGADINAQTEDGVTPLMLAAGGGHDDVIEILLSRGANARIRTKDGHNAADIAESSGRSRLVGTLRGAALF